MLMTRGSRLAIEALIGLADLGSGKWITSEVLLGICRSSNRFSTDSSGRALCARSRAEAVDISLPVTRRRSH